jgi:hypothetical protein
MSTFLLLVLNVGHWCWSASCMVRIVGRYRWLPRSYPRYASATAELTFRYFALADIVLTLMNAATAHDVGVAALGLILWLAVVVMVDNDDDNWWKRKRRQLHKRLTVRRWVVAPSGGAA